MLEQKDMSRVIQDEARVRAKSLQSYPTLCDPTDCRLQAPMSMGFSRQEHWSGLPFPSLYTMKIKYVYIYKHTMGKKVNVIK